MMQEPAAAPPAAGADSVQWAWLDACRDAGRLRGREPALQPEATTTATPRAAVAAPIKKLQVGRLRLALQADRGGEDRAIWVCDVVESGGLRGFFDRSDLMEITQAKLKEEVQASRIARRSSTRTRSTRWVRLEYEWAKSAGRKIVGLYDGDRFRWDQVSKWRANFRMRSSTPSSTIRRIIGSNRRRACSPPSRPPPTPPTPPTPPPTRTRLPITSATTTTTTTDAFGLG